MINSPSEPVPAVPSAAGRDSSPQDPHPAPRGLVPVVGAYHCREVVEQSITPMDYPRLISLVRALAPDTGSARELGEGLQWEHNDANSSFSLTINPEPPGTVIRGDLRTEEGQALYGLGAFGAGVLAAIVATAAHLPLGAIAATGLSTFGAGAWIARSLWRASSQRQGQRLQHLVHQIAAALRGELD